MGDSEYGYEDKSLIINAGEGRQSVETWQANALCALSTVLMFSISTLLTWYGKPKFVKAEVDFWKWRNIFISWIHGLIVGPWDLLCVWWFPAMMDDLVFYINNYIYLIPPFSIGYFIYDFLDMMINNKLKKEWEVTIHHVFLICGMSYSWNAKLCVSYCAIAFLAEFNSIFLHLRKLLQFAEVKFDSGLYRTVSVLNLLTFAVFRLLPLTRVILGLFIDYHRVPVSFYILCATLFPVGYLINIILFWRILKSDVLKPIFGFGKRRIE